MKHWRETAEIVDRVLALAAAGRQAAIATVIRIDGSSYRRPGAKFLIEDDGRTLGAVSGGCLEADVREVARRVIRTGTPELLHYDTGADDRTVWGLGLGCNGSVDIFVQRATDAPTLESLREMRDRISRGLGFAVHTIVKGPAEDVGRCRVVDFLALGRPTGLQADGARTQFFDVLVPAPELFVCGAGDDSRPLASYAWDAGFAVTVLDHRETFLTPDRFPAATRVHQRPDAGVERLNPDSHDCAVIKTHSFAHDRDWLSAFLQSPVRYIGLLGPRARAEKILKQLGASRDRRVFAPVGLNVGADGPEQIAVSIVGELLAVVSGQHPAHLREKGESIHAS
jgi:xanthine/CO dehydrogenase XdhC/CoxF family maturation factor